MKKIFSLVFLLSVMISFSQTTFVAENFDYDAGQSLSDNGWFVHSGGTTNPVLVSDGGLSWSGYIGSGIGNASLVNNTGIDVNRPFTENVSSGAVYASFMMNVNSNSPAGFFFHLGYANNTVTPVFTSLNTAFRARTHVAPGTDSSTQFKIGLSFNGNDPQGLTEDLNIGQTYLVVVKYQFVDGTANDEVSLYVFAENETITNEPITPDLGPFTNTASAADAPILQTVILRQYNASQDITIDGVYVKNSWDIASPAPTAPTTAAPMPMQDAADVISIYGNTYTNIATNYDPFWGQNGFGQVNAAFSVGGEDVVLAYPNFNYQGTELTTVNASLMEYLHVDIWTNADPTTSIVQVSPVNNPGANNGTTETLVTINHVAGQWYGVDIPKSAFTGMTWNSVYQMKFAANGPNSATPIDIYLDNIYFWKEPTPLGADATLSDLQVDGTTIMNFSSLNNQYSYGVAQGSMDVPQITATATDETATVMITQATQVPGNATVEVTSQNGEVVNTYTVAFSFILPTEPMTAAPNPMASASNVISLFSNAYTNVGIDTWQTVWSAGVLTDLQIEGNDTKRYTNLNFVGVEMTGMNSIDASTATSFNMNVWTPNMTQLRIKLVDFGPNNIYQGGDDTEHEIVIENPTQGEWVSLNINMDDFVNLTGRANISQLIISGNPINSGTVFIDNVYFSIPAVVVDVPTTQLRGSVCNTTIGSISQNIYAMEVMNANAYKFKVVNGMDMQEIERPSNQFSMAYYEGVTSNVTYEVSVAARIGETWGEYGAVCNVTTPNVLPTTELRTAFCNTTVGAISENIYANFVVGASAYIFRVVNGDDVQEITRPDSRFSLAFLSNAAPSTTYSVSVALMFGENMSAFGNVCTVNTPAALPTSQLRPQFCGSSVASLGSNFYAVFRSGATAYKFKTMINGQEVEVERPDSRCFMSAFEGAMMDQVYSIQVAVGYNGVFGDYGAACDLTVGMDVPGREISEDAKANFDIKAFPNPFTSQITLSLSLENELSNITMFDMTGKMVQQVSTTENEIAIGDNLTTGIYLVQIVQGQETKNIRVVKQ